MKVYNCLTKDEYHVSYGCIDEERGIYNESQEQGWSWIVAETRAKAKYQFLKKLETEGFTHEGLLTPCQITVWIKNVPDEETGLRMAQEKVDAQLTELEDMLFDPKDDSEWRYHNELQSRDELKQSIYNAYGTCLDY